MRCRIPLVEHNIQILVKKFNAEVAKLSLDYWISYVMTNQELLFNIIDQPHPKASLDVQQRISRTAGKLRKRYIRQITGLPTPRGSKPTIQAYRKFYKENSIKI
jgi:hypothetical protein